MADSVLKITFVGDGTVGKTCVLIAIVDKIFPEGRYIPTVFDNKSLDVEFSGKTYKVNLWDTAGQETYDRLRPLAYNNTRCFILCFAVDNRVSYDNITTKWILELRHYSEHVPIVLVGTKSDLRKSASLTTADGEKLKAKIKAFAYIECSAKDDVEGVQEVLQKAVQASLSTGRRDKKAKGKCALL